MSLGTDATAAIERARAFAVELAGDGPNWPVERVERRVAEERRRLAAMVARVRDEAGALGHPLSDALLRIAQGLGDIAREVNVSRPRIITWTMPRSGNAALAAFWLYGDVSRRREIVELNALPNPNRLAVGQSLRVLER